MWVDKGKTA
jgi:hypothetical protein